MSANTLSDCIYDAIDVGGNLTREMLTARVLRAIIDWKPTDNAVSALDHAYDDLCNDERDVIKAILKAACEEKL